MKPTFIGSFLKLKWELFCEKLDASIQLSYKPKTRKENVTLDLDILKAPSGKDPCKT